MTFFVTIEPKLRFQILDQDINIEHKELSKVAGINLRTRSQ